MKKKLRKIFKRLGRKGFLALWFIPFGVWGLYSYGWKGLVTALFGWGIGCLIAKRIFKIK